MTDERIVSFPESPPFGQKHYEHGRTWEYVRPGMWKSVGGSGGGGGGTPGGTVEWVDVMNKPVQVTNLAGENAGKVSLISGGNY